MKYKVGDKIKVKKSHHGECDNNCAVSISDMIAIDMVTISRVGSNYYEIKEDSHRWSDCMLARKVGKGRPKKEKPVKFIVIYDEIDGDPTKTFTSRKELMKWVKEAREDKDVVFGSIKIYPVGKEMKVEVKTNFRLKEKGGDN